MKKRENALLIAIVVFSIISFISIVIYAQHPIQLAPGKCVCFNCRTDADIKKCNSPDHQKSAEACEKDTVTSYLETPGRCKWNDKQKKCQVVIESTEPDLCAFLSKENCKNGKFPLRLCRWAEEKPYGKGLLETITIKPA